MLYDCHIHMVLDGRDWRSAIARHAQQPMERWIRDTLAGYQSLGYGYLRDGGDRWGVGKLARELSSEYGITYRTPLAPVCKEGHYGGFIGEKYGNLAEYAALVRERRRQGADFVKLMLSGIMDFDRFGVLSEEGLAPREIRELIHIAHEEGFAVMAHANGERIIEAAAAAGVDSIEHGAYQGKDSLAAMAENQVIWVPTLSAIANLRGKGRFSETVVQAIVENTMENIRCFFNLGGLIAPGTDAGAWAVPHGGLTEYDLLHQTLGEWAEDSITQGALEIQRRF